MEAVTVDIDEFLRARNAEDEQEAEAARDSDDGDWREGSLMPDGNVQIYEMPYGGVLGELSPTSARHVIRHNPQRVLDELAARRRVLERHRRLVDVDPSWAGHDWANNCYWCGDSTYDQYRVDINDCPELCDQATPFAEHPDYEERWKP